MVVFRAQLENALVRRAEELEGQVRANKELGAQLRPLIGHAKSLPQLFGDAALAQHFAERVLARVVARAVAGRPDTADDDATQSQFFETDLILPDDAPLNDAAQPVRYYYQTQLASADPSRRKAAVELLNSVVDTAIGNVFQLEQNTGGMTLQDIILGVRQILFEDGRDLVLLIEDFAALSGIQETLLKVCIQEGERDGRKVRATMRTALALTDGYLTGRDTILTRAQRVWLVGAQQQSEDEIKAAVVDMAGAYLNAARWGAGQLREQFEDRVNRGGLTGWLETWRDEGEADEQVALLDGFGWAARGVSLFPFNRAALEQMAQRHLVEGGRMSFNPRRIINEILRPVLLLRPAFETGAFPPPDLQGIRPNAFVAGWVSQVTASPAIQRRLNALLAIWGGNPGQEAALARLSPSVFTAFGLPTPAELANLKHTPEPVTPGLVSQPETESVDPHPAPVATEDDAFVLEWKAKLEAWAGGEILAQTDARNLRNALTALLSDAMDWPALRLRRQEIKAGWLHIDNARGNLAAGRRLVVCEHHQDETGAIRAGLLGALRFERVGAWSYPQADQDYVATSAIIDDLRRQLEPLLLQEAKAQAGALGRALITQARIAGMSPPVRIAGAEAVLHGLFDPAPALEATPQDEAWDALRASAFHLHSGDARSRLQSEFLEHVAAVQGEKGRAAFAIDAARVLECLTEAPETPGEGLPEDLRTFIAGLGEQRIWTRLQPLITRLRTFQESVAALIEGRLDKADFVADVREVVILLQETGAWPEGSSLRLIDFESRLIEFQGSPIVELVDRTAVVVGEAQRDQVPKLLNALGSIDLGLIQRTMSFLSTVDELLRLAEPRAAQAEAARAQANPDAIADELSALLGVMATAGTEPQPETAT